MLLYTLLVFSKYKEKALYFDTSRINHNKAKVNVIPKDVLKRKQGTRMMTRTTPFIHTPSLRTPKKVS